MSNFQILHETAQISGSFDLSTATAARCTACGGGPPSPYEGEARVPATSYRLTVSKKVGLPPLISAASRCPSSVAFHHISDEMTERLNAATAA